MKTIHKTMLTQDFTVLPNAMLRDTRLSFRARGLLAMMLSNSDDWETNFTWMCKQVPDDLDGEGPGAIRLAIKELEYLGYLNKVKEKNEGGQFDTVVWIWSDSPNLQKPKFGKPESRKPKCGNRHTKKNHQQEERSEKKKQGNEKGGFVPKRTCFVSPRYPYPTSEEEMYAILEIREVDIDPDHDGNFFNDFSKRNWRMPDGSPVYDWVETYIARLEHCAPGR